MKKITRLVFVFILTFLALEASAQLGVQVGYMHTASRGNLTLGNYNEFSGRFLNSGFQAGLTYDFTLKGELSMQTALLYSFVGGNSKEERKTVNNIYGTQTTNTMYQFIDLPIRLAYSLPVTNDFKFFFFGGPVVSYNFSGTVKNWKIEGEYPNGASTSLKNSDKYSIYDRYKISPWDIRAGAGIGVLYNNFRLKVSYDLGLINLYTGERKNANGDLNKLKRNQLSASIGYIF
ncbi:PorT family protein [Paludibacter sp. 221]|uniref:porin family protein n=1 Tax=Paludibacter sp. 221 TaxID=2302939 RepID=UPI0013D5A035|nr:porin family protein [Paludibacter sp. 221]NDV46530.1 PorT family protein [Paludibacter sp. 221]